MVPPHILSFIVQNWRKVRSISDNSHILQISHFLIFMPYVCTLMFMLMVMFMVIMKVMVMETVTVTVMVFVSSLLSYSRPLVERSLVFLGGGGRKLRQKLLF